MSKPTPTRARRARLIASAFVGSVLALGITAGPAAASEPQPAVKHVKLHVDAEEAPRDTFRPMFSRSGIRW